MRRNIFASVLLLGLLVAIFVIGCGSPASNPSPSPSPSTPPPSAAPTAGQLSDAGKTVYANSCARCHGANGEGVLAPAVIGPSASLSKYNTAQGLFTFISTIMPANAPGSLSHEQYVDVLVYLLVKNNYISPNEAFSESGLAGLQLK